ncbi:MAG: nicotinic acid mononucleotide adenyltransferase [Saonia sp.]
MKTITILLALVFSSAIYAQDHKPTFEKEGNLVKATYFHEDGMVAQTGYFLNGKLHGEWKMYNKEGEKIALGKYAEGKRTGKWFFWQGEALQEVDYEDSKIAHLVERNNSKPVVVNK